MNVPLLYFEGTARIVALPVLIDGGIRELGLVPAIGEHSARIREEYRVG